MWWFYVRDFYRAGQAEASPAPLSSPVTTKRAKALQPQHAVFSEPLLGDPIDTMPASSRKSRAKRTLDLQAEASAPASLSSYLQRLSVEGEHAFGLWDSTSGFSVFSANFERVTNLLSAEFAGHNWIATIHHQQQYALNEALLQAEEEGRLGQCLVQARASEDHSWEWLLIDIKPATARHGAIMVLIRNVSEAQALDETLKQTESALALSQRGRSAFLSSMSHELRTPLNAIMGFSEMMKSGVFGELGNSTYQQYAEHIHASGQLLLGKVNDLLDIADMDTGGLELDEERCNIRALLHEIVEMHSHSAFSRQQTLRLDCTQTIEVMADRAKLLCILSHFVSNALRHSENGAEITLTARVDRHDGLTLCVRDHGEGIPSAQLQGIRDALGAESTYFNIEPGGIGVGLSLSGELARRHGGRVVVDSIRHRGTVACLHLPAERVLAGLPAKKRQRG